MKFMVYNKIPLPQDQEAIEEMARHKDGDFIYLISENVKSGSQSMLNTWWMIVTEVSEWMAARGCVMPMLIQSDGTWEGERPFDKNDGHHLFTARFLGTDDQGRRKSWKRKVKNTTEEVVASVGDRVWAIDCLIEYATERAINVTIPRNSEYRKLKEEQGEANAA